MNSLSLPILLLLAAAPFSASAEVPKVDPIDRQQIKKVVDLFSILDTHAADPVDPAKAFYEGAIPGMLKRLDPHTVFFDPGQFEQLKQMEQSTQKGFGSVVSLLPGRVIFLQTLPGTPSQRAGILPGDEIIAINEIQLNRLEVEQLAQLLGESRQQKVALDIRRAGSSRLIRFILTPESMDAPSVERTFLLAPDIGYVRVGSFDEKTGRQIKQAIEKLGGANLKGLVLDLRNNPGGVLPAALETAGLFLKPKQKILSVRGRAAKQEDALVPDTAAPYTFPVSVLVNGKSASASEIVAGALQDHDRATIIGEPSFGKGLVQSVFSLSSSTGLALTTAFYYTPSGRSIQKHLTGQLDEATAPTRPDAMEFKTDAGRIVRGGGGIQPDEIVYPDAMSRLRGVLEATGSFTLFATEYIGKSPAVTASFEVTPAILDDFQVTLAQRNIQPSIGDWSKERAWIAGRLKEEIFNQALGVEKGDEVAAQFDPQIQAGFRAVTSRPR